MGYTLRQLFDENLKILFQVIKYFENKSANYLE